MPDHYAALDVSRTATADEIVQAYRRKARQLHPDRGGAVEAFQALQGAYAVLSDPDARREYDASLRTPGMTLELQITMTYEQAMRARLAGELVRSVLTPNGWVMPL